jgi:two-component system, NtrC family, nitrogen regulation response regulator NtrX
MNQTILVVDDEKNIRLTLSLVLEGEGFAVHCEPTAELALQALEQEEVDMILLDVRLPGMSGLELLEKIRRSDRPWAHLPVLVISGHASLQEAVDAVKLGATDFLEKPLNRDRLVITVRNCLEHAGLRREVAELRAREDSRSEMIGRSPAMLRLLTEIEKVAPTKGRVLITGESGSGKELVARAIHRLSPRANRRFVKVNCAAIPVELIESEMFGYERGAFTGAQGRKRGQFELAHGGTLLLDEIGDMSKNAQAKVLRVLQSGELVRVGGESTVEVDVRVLAATNRDLAALVREGQFREDLYFRLNVVRIHVPPLRERPEDIAPLVDIFTREICAENGFRPKPVDADVIRHLEAYAWPGNVRELKNVVERMVIMSGDRVTDRDFPDELVGCAVLPTRATVPGSKRSLREFKEEAERAFIEDTLERVGWNVSRAAAELGVERTNLHKKIKVLGICRDGKPV